MVITHLARIRQIHVNLLRMHIRSFLTACALVLFSISSAVAQQASLQELVNRAAKTTLDRFSAQKLEEKQLSITLIDMRNPARPVTASFRGNERIYPASVSKLFYLVAAHRWLEDKKIEPTPELTRALRDMIVDSSNEATQYVVDVITHTTSGYELPPKEMEEWQYKRNAVNRYFAELGYTNININQKTFCERREPQQADDRRDRALDDGDRYRQGCEPLADRADDGTLEARLHRQDKRYRRAGDWFHRQGVERPRRFSSVVQGWLDEHHASRRRVHRIAGRRKVRAGDVYDRPRE